MPQPNPKQVIARRFALPSSRQKPGLPIGKHIALRGFSAKGEQIIKPYTPVSDEDEQLGFIDFVIKARQCAYDGPRTDIYH